jgi:carbon storage regulator
VLVIRCREGESVSIGDDVEVTVLTAGPGRVKLGFKAPASVVVARQCLELTRKQNHVAVHGTDTSVLGELVAFLSGTQPNSVSCVVPVPRTSELYCRSKNCEGSGTNAINRARAADK